jgi:hypothetical protein
VPVGYARLRHDAARRRDPVLPGGRRGRALRLHRARSRRGSIGRGRRSEGGHPRASVGAGRIGGGARARRVGRSEARRPAARVVGSGAQRLRCAAGRQDREGAAGGARAPLRRTGRARPDSRRPCRRSRRLAARHVEGDRQHDRVHVRALCVAPARGLGAGGRRGRHRDGRVGRHPPHRRERRPR